MSTNLDDRGRAEALAALDRGEIAEAYELLRRALAARSDLESLNDLAVIAHALGRVDEAERVLGAVLALDPDREDAHENLEALRAQNDVGAWRRSKTLGGDDPAMYERAFPGMPRPDIMSEHTSRYAYALGFVGGADVLDLGCGTGYGSEMLTWAARSVRGFDLWVPREGERPQWPGGAQLSYGHDLCADPLPRADVAVAFEVIEHLPDAPAALRLAWQAADTIVASFPNPVHHGSWMNQYHVNDWTLEQFEDELRAAAGGRDVTFEHCHQALRSPLLTPGRDPGASYWVVVARAGEQSAPRAAALKEREELRYWQGRRNEEGELANDHYAELFTDHVGLTRDFYAGKAVLDVGCGPRGSLEWADMAARRVGLDPLADSYARLRSAPHAMEYVSAPAERMPLADASFDVVTSINSLDHVEDLDGTIAAIKRVLRPGGAFVLLTDVNHDATPCEPQSFSWDVVERFAPELELVDQTRYEKDPASMLESLRSPRSYDHSRPERRYGILAARFVKR